MIFFCTPGIGNNVGRFGAFLCGVGTSKDLGFVQIGIKKSAIIERVMGAVRHEGEPVRDSVSGVRKGQVHPP